MEPDWDRNTRYITKTKVFINGAQQTRFKAFRLFRRPKLMYPSLLVYKKV